MTNKPELLPCPFCGGAPQKIRSSGNERDGYADHVSYVCSGCGCCRGAVGDSRTGGYADNSQVEALALSAWNTRTAPAEDVRAVGEEPVGYGAWNTGTNPGTRLMRYDGMVAISPDSSDFYKVPVYLRPQRPVVLPERIDETQYRGSSLFGVRRWNACIDEFERLNK